MAQTTVTQYGAAAFAGMLDSVNNKNVRSYAAEEAIPVGYPVKLGTNPEKEVLKATAGATTIGFSLQDHVREQSSSGVVQYGVTETVNVLTQGRMWMMTDDAVVAGAKANLKTASGTLTDAAVASGIEAFTQLSVTFITATSAAGLALVEIK
ncbi:MAG: hypothetical protein RLZZ481_921 [Pseudomonadota bacterium]